MGLLDLTTDLKSLRYGKDRTGGGDSREPFITKSIDSSPGDTGGPDFLLRANTLSRTGDDLSRLGKFFISPKGLQFAAKQNVLSRTGVRVQSNSNINFNPINDGVYLPTSTLAQVAVNAEGGHLLKQGLNPFRNTSQTGATTGIGIIDNILNAELPLDQPLYVRRVTNNQSKDENRLTNLVDAKIGIPQSNQSNPINSFLDNITSRGIGGFFGGVFNNLFKNNSPNGLNISSNSNEILRYNGGPGSALGVGQTALKRVVDTNDWMTKIQPNNFFVLNYSQISGAKTNSGPFNNIQDFRTNLLSKQEKLTENQRNTLSTSLTYSDPKQRIEGRTHMGDPGRRNKNLTNYTVGAVTDGKVGPLDRINALPIYSSKNVINTDDNIKNDLVKFRIGILDNNSNSGIKKYIHFRAFVDSFSDNYSAQWGEEKFMGRAENFYRYGGFGRSIDMSWTVVAQSIDELIPMYQKLNFLASSLAPDYSENGYMQGNIAYLTFGGYCYEQPGIITGLTLSYPQEGTWEIDLSSKTGANDGGKKTKELPIMMKVSGFNFKPIHNFVPRLQQNDYDGLEVNGSTFVSSWGDEQYIALRNQFGNNYDGEGGSLTYTVPSSKTEQELSSTQVNNTSTSQGLNR